MYSLYNIPKQLADQTLEQLINDHELYKWEQHKFYNGILVPRKLLWFGPVSYSYSGLTHKPKPETELIKTLRLLIQDITKKDYNSVLLNLYETGRNSIGWHRDDEPELGKEPTIACLSVGATRTFKLRDRYTKQEVFSKPIAHGEIYVMYGKCQELMEHCVPKEFAVKKPRISLTFRYTYPS